MAQVLEEFYKPLKWQGEDVRNIVLLDLSYDTWEGYGVVIGDDETDRTIAFGDSEDGFSENLANMLFDAIVNELESYSDHTELSTIDLEYVWLESLYCWEKDEILSDYSYFKELKKIVDYIDKWYTE